MMAAVRSIHSRVVQRGSVLLVCFGMLLAIVRHQPLPYQDLLRVQGHCDVQIWCWKRCVLVG